MVGEAAAGRGTLAAGRPGIRVRPGRRVLAAAGLGVLYAALLVAVVADSPLVDLDSTVLGWAPATQWPGLLPVLSVWVLLGQRAVCLAVAVAWLGARAVRTGDPRPLLTLGVTTLLLDVSVEGVKTALGRQGPLELGRAALAQGGSVVFDGGTIFPSGHTANAVVTWGLLALLARRHRRVWGVLAGLVAVSVGLTTVYLGTHWLSDVLAGWAAGGLVLLAVPALGPVVDRLAGPAARSLGHLRRLRCAPAAGGCGASGARIDR